MAHAPENTIEAFQNALEMGATGIETDAWVTSEGIATLSHGGFVRTGLVPRRISTRERHDLPEHVPTLADLYESVGSDFELSIDVKTVAAGPAAIDAAVEFGGGAVERLWLCHSDLRRLRGWRLSSDQVRLVDSTRRIWIREGAAKRARRLAALSIDAVNLPARDWAPELVEIFHASGILAFGWGVQESASIKRLIDIGLDGIYSDHADRLVEVIGRLD